jgi:hypothetical protein
VNYEDGTTEVIPIIYGKDVRCWHRHGDDRPTTEAPLAWLGRNTFTRRVNTYVRLYVTTWTNPSPEKAVSSIDIVSTREKAAPFSVAMAIEAVASR